MSPTDPRDLGPVRDALAELAARSARQRLPAPDPAL
jgi:hypothetical protein